LKSQRIRSFGALKKENFIALKKKPAQPNELCYVQCQEKFFQKEQNQPLKQKSSLTLMPYATPIKTVNNYQVELKSLKNMQSDQNESILNQGWNWKHPSIQESFYQKIDAPEDAEDARIKMSCHQHALKDFELQIEMNDLEMNMLKDQGEVLPYNESKMEDLEQKKLKLLLGKRFHQNASNAYWYYLAKCSK
jgi:hypothetical protein